MQKIGRMLLIFMLTLAAVIGTGVRGGYAQNQIAENQTYLSFEQRLALSYLLLGAGENQEIKEAIYQRLSQHLKKMANQELETVRVQSFDEFLKIYRGDWPNSFSLASDLELIEKGSLRKQYDFEAQDPALQQKITSFIEAQNEKLSKRFQGMGIGYNENMILKLIMPALVSEEARRAAVMEGFAKAEMQLITEFKNIENIATEITAQNHQVQSASSMQVFMSLVLKNYFSRASLKTKKQIMSQIFGGDLAASSLEKFEIMIMNSGPQFQKLLQIVARDGSFDPQMQSLFKKLESKVRPIPPAWVKDMFEVERKHYPWIAYNLSPIGVGTMAQVHVGKMQTALGSRDVVIRFLKPEIAERVEEDKIILSEIAPLIDQNSELRKSSFPLIEPMVEDLTRTVTDELNLSQTIENQVQGRSLYKREKYFLGETYKSGLYIQVPEVIVADKKSVLMVQELVSGKKLDQVYEDWAEIIPDIKRVVIEELAKTWLEELAFRSGFFHSDLHQGNFLVDINADRVQVNILDFGMGGYISKDMQKSFLLLASGIEILNSKMISDALWSMSQKDRNLLTKNQLERAVSVKISELKKYNYEISIDKWAGWSINEGLRFPSDFIGVNRGLVILEKLLQDSGSQLSISKIGKQMAVSRIGPTLRDLYSTGSVNMKDFVTLGTSIFENRKTSKTGPVDMARGLRCEVVYLAR